MTKSSRNHKLFNRLTRHVSEFWQRSIGLPEGCVVALSGGIDSTLLLEVVAALGQQHHFSVRAVHVDHGTQKQQAAIEAQLQKQCDRLHVELTIVRTVLDAMASNFEARARTKRLQLLQQSLRPDKNEVIAFGHHIDDSYEWAWLQSLRSSKVTPSLGIPLINGQRVRPFMCLTRKQIASIHRRLDLWAFEDSSNQLERFARNHLRRVLQQEIGPRFPNYLEHYVARSNDLAQKLGVSVFKNTPYTIQRSEGVIIVYTSEPRQQESLLVRLHQELSDVARSSIRREISKLTRAFHRGRQGPHQLSGGVQAWILAGAIILTTQKGLKRLKKQWRVSSHIPDGSLFSKSSPCAFVAIWNAPEWVRKNGLKSHPLVHPPNDVVVLPWSRMVKICGEKTIELHWKALNI